MPIDFWPRVDAWELTRMAETNYRGLLLIGDPHLEGRSPGFRKDEYPRVILDKLAWCLEYAKQEQLLPAILGDLFDKPRDNPNWMLVELLGMFQSEVLALYGNHDVHQTAELTANDSLSLLVTAGRLNLIQPPNPWRGVMGGRSVVVGGSNYRQPIPKKFPPEADPTHDPASLVVWLTHHDILIPGYDEGRIKPFEAEGIDIIVNGHIHRRLVDVPQGRTLWITPGNISRRKRGDATRAHVPSALRIDVSPETYHIGYVEVPHQPFDEVFHEAVFEPVANETRSAFVAGLAELQKRRTSSGAGLVEFLEHNLNQFEPSVADEIRSLVKEVIPDAPA